MSCEAKCKREAEDCQTIGFTPICGTNRAWYGAQKSPPTPALAMHRPRLMEAGHQISRQEPEVGLSERGML